MDDRYQLQQLAVCAATMVAGVVMTAVGAAGVYRRRRTVTSLYLDARVWWNQNMALPRSRGGAQNGEEDDRVLRLLDDGGGNSTFIRSFVDEPTGLTVRSWSQYAADGQLKKTVLRSIGDTAAYPKSLAEAKLFVRMDCPFVLLTYINDRGEECTMKVDNTLWYRKTGPDGSFVGFPKFTRDEVYYLLGRSCPITLRRMWTEEYTLECTTADGRDVCLGNDQVFWTAAARSSNEEHEEEHEADEEQTEITTTTTVAAVDGGGGGEEEEEEEDLLPLPSPKRRRMECDDYCYAPQPPPLPEDDEMSASEEADAPEEEDGGNHTEEDDGGNNHTEEEEEEVNAATEEDA